MYADCCDLAPRSHQTAGKNPQPRLHPQMTGVQRLCRPSSTGPAVTVVGMTTSQPDFMLNRPGALIAALPAVLGFVPEKSLVLVTMDRGEMGAVMRVDLSPRLADTVARI